MISTTKFLLRVNNKTYQSGAKIFGLYFAGILENRTCRELCVVSEKRVVMEDTSQSWRRLTQSQVAVKYSTASDQTSTDDKVTVCHDPDRKRFYIEISGVGTANIEYERRDQLMIFKHTEVPTELGGRGLGKILAKDALEYVAKNDLQLEIQCSFIRKYVSKYEPKYIKYIKK